MSSSSTAADNAPWLLLLPRPPPSLNATNLAAAFRPPIKAALKQLCDKADQSSGSPRVLVIALATALLEGAAPRLKSLSWTKAQALVSGLYGLVSSLCAELNIATDMNTGPGSVDARIVLVDHEAERQYSPDVTTNAYLTNNTTVLDLAAFASTVHPWSRILNPSGEPGYQLLKSYLQYAEGKQHLRQDQLGADIPGGLSVATDNDDDRGTVTAGYSVSCLGGTFDHLHPGHKLLLHATALLLNVPGPQSSGHCVMIVGISGDELLTKKKYAEELQSWDERAATVLSFLSTIFSYSTTAQLTPTHTEDREELHANFRDGKVLVRCVKIHDAFGPTISEENVDVIVVSGETRSGGQAINDRRRDKGWRELDIFEIDVLDAGPSAEGDEKPKADGFESKISSTAIRKKKAEAKAQSTG